MGLRLTIYSLFLFLLRSAYKASLLKNLPSPLSVASLLVPSLVASRTDVPTLINVFILMTVFVSLTAATGYAADNAAVSVTATVLSKSNCRFNSIP